MAASIFPDKQAVPTDDDLARELGGSKILFDRLADFIRQEFPPVTTEWKHYGQNAGWVLKMYSGSRNLFFVVPCSGYFKLAFTFGDRAVERIFLDQFPESLKSELANTRKYAEGRTIQLEIKTGEEAEIAKKLARIKVLN
jgi:hypothetical protein